MNKKGDNVSSHKKSRKEETAASKWKQFAETEQPVAEEVDKSQEEITGQLEFPSRDELEKELTSKEMKLEEYKNQLMHTQAEYENLRKRTEREVAKAHKYGIERFVIDLLPVVDSITRGLEGPESNDPHVKSVREGMQLTLDMLEKILMKHGVTPINPTKGDEFNPLRHEAMSMQTDPNAKSNTILEVLQKGYELNGRILRAAMVIVAQ